MGLFEKNQMSNKYREAVLTTVLVYQDLAKTTKTDPLNLLRLSPMGVPFTGKELAKKVGKRPKDLGDKDSVWWVTINPNTSQVSNYVQIADDIGQWKKQINKQLEKWGQKSELKKIAKKRAIAAGVIAAIVVAVVVVTVLTAGTGTAAAGGAVAASTGGTAAGGGAAAGGAVAGGAVAVKGGAAAAGGGGALLASFKDIAKDIATKGLEGAAENVKGSLPPKQQEQVEQAAKDSAKDADAALEGTPEWLYPAVGVGIAALVATAFLLGKKK
jgi:hypothetical protein